MDFLTWIQSPDFMFWVMIAIIVYYGLDLNKKDR